MPIRALLFDVYGTLLDVHGLVAALFDIGENAFYGGADLTVGLLSGLDVLAALQPLRHSSILSGLILHTYAIIARRDWKQVMLPPRG